MVTRFPAPGSALSRRHFLKKTAQATTAVCVGTAAGVVANRPAPEPPSLLSPAAVDGLKRAMPAAARIAVFWDTPNLTPALRTEEHALRAQVREAIEPAVQQVLALGDALSAQIEQLGNGGGTFDDLGPEAVLIEAVVGEIRERFWKGKLAKP